MLTGCRFYFRLGLVARKSFDPFLRLIGDGRVTCNLLPTARIDSNTTGYRSINSGGSVLNLGTHNVYLVLGTTIPDEP